MQYVTLTCVEYSSDELFSSKFTISIVIHAAEDVENAWLAVTQPLVKLCKQNRITNKRMKIEKIKEKHAHKSFFFLPSYTGEKQISSDKFGK